MHASLSKFLSLTLIILPITASSTSLQETPQSEVLVKVQSTNFQGGSRVMSLYTLTESSCQIAWQSVLERNKQERSLYLMDRSSCKLSFSESQKLHEKVLRRVLKDYPASSIKGIRTGGLRSLQPDGSWNSIVAKAASGNSEYQDYRKNYPNHASKKSSNDIFIDLIKQTKVSAPFQKMLEDLNLGVELESVEKVFNGKDENNKTVINDAGVLWWKAQ